MRPKDAAKLPPRNSETPRSNPVAYGGSPWPLIPSHCSRPTLSKRIGHADVAFTMKQYVQTDLEADRQVANTLAQLIIGGSLASIEEVAGEADDTSRSAA